MTAALTGPVITGIRLYGILRAHQYHWGTVMIGIRLILFVLAFICFFLSAIGYPPSERINLQSLGLAFTTLAFIAT